MSTSPAALSGHRSIYIPEGILDGTQVNVIYIPPALQKLRTPLYVRRVNDRLLTVNSLPSWNDELSQSRGRSMGHDDSNNPLSSTYLFGGRKTCPSSEDATFNYDTTGSSSSYERSTRSGGNELVLAGDGTFNYGNKETTPVSQRIRSCSWGSDVSPVCGDATFDYDPMEDQQSSNESGCRYPSDNKDATYNYSPTSPYPPGPINFLASLRMSDKTTREPSMEYGVTFDSDTTNRGDDTYTQEASNSYSISYDSSYERPDTFCRGVDSLDSFNPQIATTPKRFFDELDYSSFEPNYYSSPPRFYHHTPPGLFRGKRNEPVEAHYPEDNEEALRIAESSYHTPPEEQLQVEPTVDGSLDLKKLFMPAKSDGNKSKPEPMTGKYNILSEMTPSELFDYDIYDDDTGTSCPGALSQLPGGFKGQQMVDQRGGMKKKYNLGMRVNPPRSPCAATQDISLATAVALATCGDVSSFGASTRHGDTFPRAGRKGGSCSAACHKSV